MFKPLIKPLAATALLALAIGATSCQNARTYSTDDYVMSIESADLKDVDYHPSFNGDTIVFVNRMPFIACRMQEADLTLRGQDAYNGEMIFCPVDNSAKIYKVSVVFKDTNKRPDFNAVANALADPLGYVNYTAAMQQAYMLTIIDSTKRVEPTDTTHGWAGAYSIRKCCGIAAFAPEGFNNQEWPVSLRDLKLGMTVPEINDALAKYGLKLVPMDGKKANVSFILPKNNKILQQQALKILSDNM